MLRERLNIRASHKDFRLRIADRGLKFFVFFNFPFRILHFAIKASPLTLEPILLTFMISMLLVIVSPLSLHSEVDPASEWNYLYPKIRDRLISKGEAQEKLKALEILLKDFYIKTTRLEQDDRLCFPLRGYGPSAIGGKGGNGYQIQGYDFFDGNQHKGHPGHDVFILDQNQDGLDDRTGKPVEVIAAASGVVVSINLHWEPSSPIRGGNYIWIYDPIKSRYYYYAHLNEIFVKVGQIVSCGEPLGTVGRTGVKAYPKKSPTHLHFTVHQSKDGYPKPLNPFMELIKASCQERLPSPSKPR
jgi:murein DD-endopeptidase MepM/ murein hydrolase activator NlpD